MSDNTVLLVDDEINILKSLERLLIEDDLDVLKARNGDEAIELLRKEEVAVLISDNQMPGMKGTELLSKVKQIAPDVVKILLTGYADVETVMSAVNEGEVFRVLVKPWNDNVLKNAVEEGIKRYQIIRSLKKADESTMFSLAETIELKDTYTKGHCDRVAEYARIIADALGLDEAMKKDIKFGSWLHDCGKIGVPESILNSSVPLNDKELELVKNHPTWGSYIAKQAQLSETVTNIIVCHHERFDGKGYPKGISGSDIPIEARIVAVAECYDAITSDRPYRKAYPKEKGLEIILSMKDEHFDPEIVDAFISKIKDADWQKYVQEVERV